MIAHLNGLLLERAPARVIVEVGGVGYEVFIPVSTFAHLPAAGQRAALHVHTHVREEAIQLYGFATPLEKNLFEKLLAVSGVGPKVALAVLSGMAARDLAAAIAHSDWERLTAIPGVGRKTAERLCVELRDKLDGLAAGEESGGGETAGPLSATAGEVLSALVNLGYPRPTAEKAVSKLAAADSAGFEDLFKRALAAMR